MELSEFAKMLDGKEYGYSMFTEGEIQVAKDNGFVIVYGVSDDLVELEGAITDERGCFNGGKIHVKAVTDGGIMFGNCEISNVFSFEAKWCEDKDESGNIIPWTYDVSIEHATFMIYEDGKPYCRGFVFKVVDAEPKVKMVKYEEDYVPEELCTIDRLGGIDDVLPCNESCRQEDCVTCVVTRVFNDYARVTKQEGDR